MQLQCGFEYQLCFTDNKNRDNLEDLNVSPSARTPAEKVKSAQCSICLGDEYRIYSHA